MGTLSCYNWQGRVQSRYNGVVANGYFPATDEQKAADWLGDDFIHFICDSKNVLDDLQFRWKHYHLENMEEMASRQWKPTKVENWVHKFVLEVLKADIISIRDCQFKHERGAVY